MRGNQMLQPAAIDLAQQVGSRQIVKMPQAPRDATLQRNRIARCSQQVGIVIEFKDQRVYATQYITDMARNVTDIGQQSEASDAVRKNELDRLPGIVRYWKWLNFDCFDPERQMAVDDPHIHAFGK